MVNRIAGGLLIAGTAVATLFIGRELLKTTSGCERANSSNAVELASLISNGTFPGTIPDFFIDFTTPAFLNGEITQEVWIDAYNFLLEERLIFCN